MLSLADTIFLSVLCTKPTITIVIKVSNITSEQTRSEIFRFELASDRHESHIDIYDIVT